MARPPKEYTLYQHDQFITTGTIREIATEMEMSENRVRSFSKPSYQKKYKNKKIEVVKLEEEL